MIQSPVRTQARSLPYLIILTWMGCASSTYHYGVPDRPVTRHLPDDSNQMTLGGVHPRLDKAERWVHYPSEKWNQWFPGDEPVVAPEESRRLAVRNAQEYLLLNELNDVKIDVRRYDPATQWRRLRENEHIHPVWKYTGGVMSHLSYTLVPRRVFRMDSFNPYTNTLSLNSSDPSMALYTAAEAKIIFNRRYPGLYLAACRFPIFGITKNIRVANDVLSYARDRQDWDLERELTTQIYSNFGSDLLFHALPFVPGSDDFPFFYVPALSLAASTAGEATGHAVLLQRDRDRHHPEATTGESALRAETEGDGNRGD